MNETEEKQYVNEESDAAEARVKKLRRALKGCLAEKQEYLAGWQRAQADFQNYKKHQEAEMGEFRKFVNLGLIFRILPILDNLVAACESVPENNRNDPWAKGVLNVKRQFENALAEEGLEEIKVQRGDKFNAEIHEAISEMEGKEESGTVAEVLQRGYKLHGKIIRAAKVKVNK